MEYSEVTKLEQELTGTLKEEYSFYQSLFILVDKQRDHLKYDREQRLVDLNKEVDRLYGRIRESEDRIAALRKANRKLFNLASSAPEVRRLTSSIATLISKSLKLVEENRTTVNARYDLVRQKLAELQRNGQIVSYLRSSADTSHYLDQKQ
jgi:hypothetical protein